MGAFFPGYASNEFQGLTHIWMDGSRDARVISRMVEACQAWTPQQRSRAAASALDLLKGAPFDVLKREEA